MTGRSVVLLLDEAGPSFCYYAGPPAGAPGETMSTDVVEQSLAYAEARSLAVQVIAPRAGVPERVRARLRRRDHVCYVPVGSASLEPQDVPVVDLLGDGDQALATEITTGAHAVAMLRVAPALLERWPDVWWALAARVPRVVLVPLGLDGYGSQDLERYRLTLDRARRRLEGCYAAGRMIELSVLSDRLVLQQPAECGAGLGHLTVAPSGALHICPGFALAGEPSIGALPDEPQIPNRQLLARDHAPICAVCDAYHCRRCVHLNLRATLEVNTPPWQVCRAAHLEREATRRMLATLQARGLLTELPPIEPLEYDDPIERLTGRKWPTEPPPATTPGSALGRVASVWELTPEQVEQLYRERHLNNYVHAGLGALRAADGAAPRLPTDRPWRLRPDARPASSPAVLAAVDALLGWVPSLAAPADPTAARVEVTTRVHGIYQALPAEVTAGQVAGLMRLLAGCAWLPLVADRHDRLPLWFHRPVRELLPWQRRLFEVLWGPGELSLEALLSSEEAFGGELRDAVASDTPMGQLFALTIRLVATTIVTIENGVASERPLAAFEAIEAAMIDFERRHGLGQDPAMPLNVRDPAQLRYRNTVYLYGGNLLERSGRRRAARAWYLRDIEQPCLPDKLGFTLTALKTCERLLCALRVSDPAERPALRSLLDASLARALSATRENSTLVLETIAGDPSIDLSPHVVDLPSGRLFFSGEACREPMLAALIYRQVIDGVPYDSPEHGALFEAAEGD